MWRFLKTKAAATAGETITAAAAVVVLVAEAVNAAVVVALLEAAGPQGQQAEKAVHQEVAETAALPGEVILLKGKEGPAEANTQNILA